VAQHLIPPSSSERISIVDAVAPHKRRRHQRHSLASNVGAAMMPAQVHLLVEELLQAQMLAQGRRQEQARIGGQAVVVKGHVQAVQTMR
jgi:hypothetical protein